MNLKKNKYEIQGDTTILHCDYREVHYEVLIDTEDLSLVLEGYGKWCINPARGKKTKDYVQATILGTKGKKMSLHRLIMGNPIGKVVDHKDGNTMNNKKYNLRVTTQLINSRNRQGTRAKSGHKGVRWHEKDKRWRAEIKVKGKKIYLGNFRDIQDAIIAREKGEEQYWGSER